MELKLHILNSFDDIERSILVETENRVFSTSRHSFNTPIVVNLRISAKDWFVHVNYKGW